MFRTSNASIAKFRATSGIRVGVEQARLAKRRKQRQEGSCSVTGSARPKSGRSTCCRVYYRQRKPHLGEDYSARTALIHLNHTTQGVALGSFMSPPSRLRRERLQQIARPILVARRRQLSFFLHRLYVLCRKDNPEEANPPFFCAGSMISPGQTTPKG